MIHLHNVDWHATDRCNLRCASCGHFCSLVNHFTDETDRTPELSEGFQTEETISHYRQTIAESHQSGIHIA